MTTSRKTGRGVLLVLGFVLLLAGCSTHPEISNWVLVRPDGVTIEFGVDTCNADLDASVVESDTRVEVTITAKNDTTDDCRDHLIISLDGPLDGRELVDASTGETLEVRFAGN
jgi:hypothetical protein